MALSCTQLQVTGFVSGTLESELIVTHLT
jgi:hypothetical protein